MDEFYNLTNNFESIFEQIEKTDVQERHYENLYQDYDNKEWGNDE